MFRFIIRALSIALLHFVIAMTFVFAWRTVNESENQQTWKSFGYSAGASAFASPLFQITIARQRLPFFAGMAINSALWGIVLAIIFSRARRLWLLLLFPFLWFGALTAASVLLERRVDRDADRVPMTTRFPHQNANTSSQRIDQIIPSLEGQDSAGMHGRLQRYLADEFGRGDDRIEPMPVDVEHFVVAHRFDLDSLEIALLINEPPRWEVDLTAARKPDWLRYFWLQKLILADALDSARARDFAGARQRLEAAGRLTSSLSTRPEPIGVMTAIASTENQLGVARKLGIVLPRFDPRDQLVDALKAESWTNRFLITTSRFDSEWHNRSALSRALLTIFVRPYARLCAAKSALDQVHNVAIIQDLNRCVFQALKNADERPPILVNPITVSTASATEIRAVRLNRLVLDFEGTEKIAQLKSTGATTSASFCANYKWLHEGNVVHLEPTVAAANAALPTRHTINPEARMPTSETSPATPAYPSFPK